MYSAVRDLGQPYSIDDLRDFTDPAPRRQHDAIRDAFWTAVETAADADPRIETVNRTAREFSVTGAIRAVVEDAMDEAVAAGYDAAEAVCNEVTV